MDAIAWIAWTRDGVTYRVEADELVIHLDGDPPDVVRRRPLLDTEASLVEIVRRLQRERS